MTNTSNSGRGRYIRLLCSIGDLAVINLLFLLAARWFPCPEAGANGMRELFLLVNVSYIPVVIFVRNSPHEQRAIRMEYVMSNTLVTVGLHALFFISLQALMGISLSERTLLAYYALLFATLTLFHLSGNFALKNYRRRGYNFTRVAIVGSGPTAVRLVEALNSDAGFGYKILGVFDDGPSGDFSGVDVLPVGRLADFVAEHDIEQIFFTLSGHNSALQQVTKIADDHVVQFYYVPQLPRTLNRGFELHNIGPVPVLALRRNPLNSFFCKGLKRSFDLVVSSVFLLFYPLIYIPVAVGVKLSSPGPVYFRQERTGYRGKSFVCLKFRTMRMNGGSDSTQATRNDPRKTAFGDFLRRTSLDELPQFINVWRGEMSIVGPRPHMLKHTELYTRLVDAYMVRHAVKPGITGWAQVNGFRGITDELWKMERRVEADVWYIENWTFLLDLKIMVRTVINALSGEKNAF